MTSEEQRNADTIITRLLKKETVACAMPEEIRRMNELAETIWTEYFKGNYQPFLVAAKELNGMYKRLTEGHDDNHWEH